VFLSLAYLGLQIIIEKRATSNTLCTLLVLALMIISLIFLVFKIIFVIMIHSGSIKHNEKLHLSLGIAVGPDDMDAWLVTKTFISDVTALIVSILLFVGSILKSKSSKEEFDDKNIESLKVTGARSPMFWISI
jgi:hypothetical protein